MTLKGKAASGSDHACQGSNLCRLLQCLCRVFGTPDERLCRRAKYPELNYYCFCLSLKWGEGLADSFSLVMAPHS